jgi:folate-binding protein YgfZ
MASSISPAELAQYQAVRRRAGLIDRSDRGRIAVAGRDRAAFLQGLLTNDIAAVTPEAGCYAACLTPQGRMIADMRVAETGEALLLDVEPDVKDDLIARFDRMIFAEQVRLEDLTAAWSAVAVHGPDAPRVVAAALGGDAGPGTGDAAPLLEETGLAGWAEHRTARAALDGAPVLIVANRETGERGFDLFVAAERSADLMAACRAAGAAPAGRGVLDTLRIEAGRPRFGLDMDHETIPLEAGIEGRAISFSKGCYVGQEVVIRVLHRGHGRVARRLVGLMLDGAASRGDAILAGGKVVGKLTSATFSPALERPIALGYVHRDLSEPGTAITVEAAGRLVAARVASLPFVAPGA